MAMEDTRNNPNEESRLSSPSPELENSRPDREIPGVEKDIGEEKKISGGENYPHNKIKEIEERIKIMNEKMEDSKKKLQASSQIINLNREIELTKEKHIKVLKQKLELQDSVPSLNIKNVSITKEGVEQREKDIQPQVLEFETQIEGFIKSTEEFRKQIQDLKQNNFGNEFARVDSYTQDELRTEIAKLEDQIKQSTDTLEMIKTNNL